MCFISFALSAVNSRHEHKNCFKSVLYLAHSSTVLSALASWDHQDLRLRIFLVMLAEVVSSRDACVGLKSVRVI